MTAPSKTPSRTRGEIEELPSGSLRVRVYAGIDPVTKKKHYLVETVPAGPKAAKEAEKIRTKLLNQVDERRSAKTNALFDVLTDRWLEVLDVEPSTRRGYERNVRVHIRPLLGSIKAARVDVHTLESFYAVLRNCRRHCAPRPKKTTKTARPQIRHHTDQPHECDKRCQTHDCKPLADSTVRQIHWIVSGILDRGVRWGWIPFNPADHADKPALAHPNPDPPTADEAARIVTAAWKDPDWGALVWLVMTTGVRRGEVCALRWLHFELKAVCTSCKREQAAECETCQSCGSAELTPQGTLVVKRSIDQDGTTLTEGDTKTHQQRRIALDVETIAVILDHRTRCAKRVQLLGYELDDAAYMFSLSPDNSTPIKPDNLTQRYIRLAKRLGIVTHLHALRHYTATELITAGVDARTVAGRLGHGGGGATTLRVYSAWVSEADQRAASTLSARMPRSPITQPTEGPAPAVVVEEEEPSSPYRKIAADLRGAIRLGLLRTGDQVPTPHELAERYSVSASTAHRAINLLRDEGLILTEAGKRATVI